MFDWILSQEFQDVYWLIFTFGIMSVISVFVVLWDLATANGRWLYVFIMAALCSIGCAMVGLINSIYTDSIAYCIRGWLFGAIISATIAGYKLFQSRYERQRRNLGFRRLESWKPLR